ncbi:MAG TPA: hypothetical protein VMA36_09240 [Candidatus Limnocylindria bacterium]|nr:hypothetical protein [Candidatus Limnocylindria bacterium]
MDRLAANRAYDDLIAAGFKKDAISLMMSEETRKEFSGTPRGDRGEHVATGAASGGVIGGAIGAIVAGLTATGAITATVATGGLAAPIVAGPLAAALAGLGAGAAGGGIIGALVGAGIPAEEARTIERGIREGAVVVAVDARPTEIDTARRILRSEGATQTSPRVGTVRGEVEEPATESERRPIR